ncbi:MAG: HmuY family protein [Bacteroidota bacterium]
MKKYLFLSAIMSLSVMVSCGDDDGEDLIDFTVSFSSETVSLSEADTDKEISLTFSRAATESGTITVAYTGNNAEYGTDFSTLPTGGNGTIAVPVAVGDLGATITFTKLQDPIEGTTKTVSLALNGYDQTDWSNGITSSSTVSFTPIAAISGVIDAEQGGSNQPNQVYVDLSSNTQTAVRRDTWEIAFYNGAENRVFLNPSLLVAAAELEGITDILSITEDSDLANALKMNTFDQAFQPATVTVTTVGELVAGLPVAYPQYGNVATNLVFTDNREGTLEGTAFAAVSTTADQNNVYIVSLGNEIPTESAELGSISTTGDQRGFLKVRVLTDGNSYTVQYADLNETENFSEATIEKNDSFNLSAFSLTEGQSVNVEPEKGSWDLNFTGVFSFYGVGNFGGPPTIAGLTFSDYVLHNTLGGTGLYQVTTYERDGDGNITNFDVPSYTDFNRDDVEESAFIYNDRAVIGSGWRSVFGVAAVRDDRYFVLKDMDGNYYKLLFTAFTNSEGERGFPQFTYERL